MTQGRKRQKNLTETTQRAKRKWHNAANDIERTQRNQSKAANEEIT
jgi:hypothetical protein